MPQKWSAMLTSADGKTRLYEYVAAAVGAIALLVLSRYVPVTREMPGATMLAVMVVVGLTCGTGPTVLAAIIATVGVEMVRPAPTLLVHLQRGFTLGLFGATIAAVGMARLARLGAVRQYQVLFDDNPLPMLVFDPLTTGFLRVNNAALSLYGYTRDEFARMSLRDIRAVDDPPEPEDDARYGDAEPSMTARHRTADGRVLDMFVRLKGISMGGRQARLALLEDVTERRNLEAQLRQAQKMDAIGQLAAGVAHDFNNLLAVIQGFTTLTIETLPEKDERRADLVQVVQAGARAADLTQQLLAFSRKQLLQVRVLAVNDVIEETAPMLRRLIGETMTLETTTRAQGLAKADAGQLQQVLLNLVVNARDAMAGTGQITIETADVELDAAYCQQHPSATPGPHVLVAVSDTGRGMDAATQARIFEPFFTTKPVGQGTGLGLSTVYGIVKQLGGHVWAYSELGKGTTFKMYLPRTGERAESPVVRARRMRSIGTRMVLMVEDEAGVRAMTSRILTHAGYVVQAAESPLEALALVSRGEARPDILLTDVVMPGMNGQALATEVLAQCPACKVVFMSGYTDAAAFQMGELPADAVFVSKPFTSAGLTETLADLFEPLPSESSA